MTTYQVSPDDAAVLTAFGLELRNLYNASWDDFRRSFFEGLRAEEKKATEFAIEHPGGRMVVDWYHIRSPLYREHANKIGKDFLSAFNDIIKPHCQVISNDTKSVITKFFYERYRSSLVRIHSDITAYLASIGRPKEFESHYATIAGWYGSSQTKYYSLLEAEIAKHNLSAEPNKSKLTNSKPTSAEPTQHQPHIAKHKIVKEGVKKLFDGLKLENPEATLETAKRLYANLNGESYTNINKAYHYKGKK